MSAAEEPVWRDYPSLVHSSGRETTVLLHIAWGYTNKEISSRLNISVKTVEAHKANGMRKLQLSGRSALVRQAVTWGWLAPDRAPDNRTTIRPHTATAQPEDLEVDAIGNPHEPHGQGDSMERVKIAATPPDEGRST